uniref:Protein kinase domain-containing protein n=1 Tax=Ananas comosus var. bracteatus TaxID=296719 RepID=A0A6V7NNI6_ANACO|nr:unnamed protein product [Ananas comosus var. bracteatus]
MTKLQTIRLDGNYLNDTVPNWFSSLSNLTVLQLQSNRLKGFELPALPKGVVTVLLSKNLFTGEIPQQFTELARLQHLDLSFNLLVGTPPEGLFSLPNISYLNMASNMLTGLLPKSMICSSQLGYVDLSTNRFIGDLPDCLTLNSNKRVVKFNRNCLSIDPNTSMKLSIVKRAVGRGESLRARELGRGCQKAISEQHLLLKQMPDNSATGLSSELLANARYISQAAKLGKQILPTYRVFSVEELKEATKNFEHSAYIGEGSVGKLYKGRLENGSFVAIRCLQLFKREIINSEDDVYSFGCILLEVLAGPSYFEKGEAYIVNELTTPICSQQERNRVLDSVVVGTSSQESLSAVISITTKCLLPDSSIRPSIEEVLWNLQYAAQIQQTTDGDQRSEVSSQS